MLQKSRIPQIQGIKAEAVAHLPSRQGGNNAGDAVLSAFLKGKKHSKKLFS
jgi:hypothetical protein